MMTARTLERLGIAPGVRARIALRSGTVAGRIAELVAAEVPNARGGIDVAVVAILLDTVQHGRAVIPFDAVDSLTPIPTPHPSAS